MKNLSNAEEAVNQHQKHLSNYKADEWGCLKSQNNRQLLQAKRLQSLNHFLLAINQSKERNLNLINILNMYLKSPSNKTLFLLIKRHQQAKSQRNPLLPLARVPLRCFVKDKKWFSKHQTLMLKEISFIIFSNISNWWLSTTNKLESIMCSLQV